MREILFRGKRKDNGEWVEGYLVKKADPLLGVWSCFILVQEFDTSCIDGRQTILKSEMTWYKVNPETVGQYTGLTDKNGVKIFEGDVVKVQNDYAFVICYGEYFPKFYCEAIKDSFGMVPDCMHIGLFGGSIKTGEEVILTNCTHLYEIIGNIHDNPELLKEGGNDGTETLPVLRE